MIITIDGPAGSGKSSIAREVAHILHIPILDTGALYRAFAYALFFHKIDIHNEQQIERFLQEHPLSIREETDGLHYYVAHLDTTPFLREQEIGELSSIISTYHTVRKQLLPVQREYAKKGDLICEGRDMGSTVFPEADVKIFITARPEIRALRRQAETQNIHRSLQEIEDEIRTRDQRDRSRTLSPLIQPADASVLDTSDLSIHQVVEKILFLIKQTQPDTAASWEHFAHQADIGIRGRGRTPAQAFEQAAIGLMAIMSDPKTIRPLRCFSLECRSTSLELLFLEWLNQVIYEVETKHMLFRYFRITMTESTLYADLWGEPIDLKKHQPKTAPKAATYHKLSVEQTQGRWYAQAVIDV